VYAPIEEDASLAYSIELHAGSGVDWLVMVEAHTGEVLASINQVCSAAAQGSGMDAGGQTQTIELWEEEHVFTMVNTTKPMFDAQRSDPPFYQTTFGGISIFDAKGVNPQQDPQAFNPQPVTSTDAHSGFGPNAVSASVNLAKVYDYYQKQHHQLCLFSTGGRFAGRRRYSDR
jgi:Zn-dependent metalloprotease